MPTSIPILTYHALDEGRSPVAFPPARFREGLWWLADRGCRTARLSDLDELVPGDDSGPVRVVVITFDDGYRSVFEEALPVLGELEMTATVFLAVGERPLGVEERFSPLCGREMLNWREVREMAELGIEFGAHTLTHPDLTRLPPEEVEREIRESKDRLEQALGARVKSFAYPFGRWDGVSHRIAQRWFRCACSDRLGLANAGSDRFALPRVDAYYLRRPGWHRLLTTRWLPLYLWARRVPRELRRRLAPGR